MAHAYRHPRAAMSRLLAGGITEARVLGILFLACGFGFVASLPEAARKARALEIEDPLAGAVAAHLFAYLFIAPLIAYAAAAALHLLARPFGARGGFLGARAALFWSALLGAPMALALAALRALVAGGAVPREALALAAWAACGLWLWLFAANFAEAEGFGPTWRVALALGLAFAAVAVSLSLLTRGAPLAG